LKSGNMTYKRKGGMHNYDNAPWVHDGFVM
jgi:hypothetical protein